jgi:hypothetical protein
MMARFSAIPNPPQTEMSGWQYYMLTALKENVELLTGARGEKDGASRAVTKASVTVTGAPDQTMRQVTAQGAAVNIDGAVVPAMEDYVELIKNVQSLANDVAAVRATLNTLIGQLRG